jgi:hypothetical protein
MAATYAIDEKKLKAQLEESKAPKRMPLEAAIAELVQGHQGTVRFEQGAEVAAAFVTSFHKDPALRTKTPSPDEQEMLFGFHQAATRPAAFFSTMLAWRGARGLLELALTGARYSLSPWFLLRVAPRPVSGGLLPSLLRFVLAADPSLRAWAKARCREAKLPRVDQATCAFVFNDAEWANEVIDAWLATPFSREASWEHAALLGTTDDPARVRRFIAYVGDQIQHIGGAAFLSRLVHRLSAEDIEAIFVPLLGAGLKAKWKSSNAEPYAKLVAHVKSEEVARVLALWMGEKAIAKIADGYFRMHPELASALAPVAKGKGKAAPIARALMDSLGRTQIAKPEVARAEDEAPKTKKTKATKPVVRSKDEGLPPSLVSPPWAEKKKAPRETRRVEMIVPHESLHVTDPKPLRQLTRSREVDARVLDGLAPAQVYGGHIMQLTEPVALEALAGRDAMPGLQVEPFVTWLGDAAVPHVIRFIAADLTQHHRSLAGAISPRLGLACAHASLSLSPSAERTAARAWLEAHSAEAALGLVPALFGEDESDADVAERVLCSLDARHPGPVRESLLRYGDSLVQAVRALLDKDPDARFPRKMPNKVKWAAPERLGSLVCRSGVVLSEKHIETFVQMLQISTLNAPYQGALETLALLTPTSRAAFADALLREYLLAGSPPSQAWILSALALLAPREAIALLKGQMRLWAADGKVALLHESLDTLAWVGTDEALVVVFDAGQRSRYDDTREKVRLILEKVASARGISYASLEDQLVPELGLEHGAITLPLGTRTLTVRLGAHLEAELLDEAGSRLKAFPRKAKSDLDEAYAKAKAAYVALEEAAESIGRSQVLRFERAMRDARRWTMADLRAHVFAQPLLRHIAARLIWQVEETGALFRVAEDLSLADAADNALPFPASDAHIVIAHPVSAPRLQAFQAWAADYRVLQPFAQLGRATFALEARERGASEITRQSGRKSAYLGVLALTTGMGWKPVAPGDKGIDAITRTPAPGLVARLALSPGLLFGGAQGRPEQTLGALTLAHTGGTPAPLEMLEERVLSELLLDVMQLG